MIRLPCQWTSLKHSAIWIPHEDRVSGRPYHIDRWSTQDVQPSSWLDVPKTWPRRPTCPFLKALKFKTAKVPTQMLEKFCGHMSMTNGKRLADLSTTPKKQQETGTANAFVHVANQQIKFCFLKISRRMMPEVPNIEGRWAPWNMLRGYSFNYTELLRPAPAVEKQEFRADLAGLWFWTIPTVGPEIGHMLKRPGPPQKANHLGKFGGSPNFERQSLQGSGETNISLTPWFPHT